MAKFRKKPVVIDAFQVLSTGYSDNLSNLKLFVEANGDSYEAHFNFIDHGGDASLKVRTLEGELNVSPNDFIIRGVNGEYYPCKPDIFEKTYEPA